MPGCVLLVRMKRTFFLKWHYSNFLRTLRTFAYFFEKKFNRLLLWKKSGSPCGNWIILQWTIKIFNGVTLKWILTLKAKRRFKSSFMRYDNKKLCNRSQFCSFKIMENSRFKVNYLKLLYCIVSLNLGLRVAECTQLLD